VNSARGLAHSKSWRQVEGFTKSSVSLSDLATAFDPMKHGESAAVTLGDEGVAITVSPEI
jgi:hypothetical protein